MVTLEKRSAHRAAAADQAVRWLAESGIQAPSGGCHAWFDRRREAYSFTYAEATGYYVTLAVWLAKTTGDEAHLARAERAVRWLLDEMQRPDGGFRCLNAEPASRAVTAALTIAKAERRYAFDAGVILQGLVAFARATGDAAALDGARRAGRWLAELQDPAGAFIPFTGSPTWRHVPADWSTRPGPHQSKVAIALAALGETAEDRSMVRRAVATARAALRWQLPSGQVVTNPSGSTSNAHPHCYAAESWWAIGTAAGDAELLEAARLAIFWLLDQGDEEAAVPRTVPVVTSRRPRLDAAGQALRLGTLLGADTKRLDSLEVALLAGQVAGPDRRAEGGIAFEHGGTGGGDHVNVWVTSFAVQALLVRSGNPLPWSLLV